MPIKWFGATGFGREYFEANVVYLVRGDRRTILDRKYQTGFVQYLDRAVRTFEVDGCAVVQTFFVPNHVRAFVMSLEADSPAQFAVQSEFDMRYYQAFNQDFSACTADITDIRTGPALQVFNRVQQAGVGTLEFNCVLLPEEDCRIELLPKSQRLRRKTYLKDEKRLRLIQSVYAETREKAPDEAPIWDTYDTFVYAPAEISGSAPLTLVFGFGDRPGEAEASAERVKSELGALRKDKANRIAQRFEAGLFETDHPDTDQAYRQILSRFDQALVARDVTLDVGDREMDHYSAIFAGNKYFLDAWKRDENISLIGLLAVGDYETVRSILANTWQYQDPRTGRLPHIIRLGEPLVYYASDGTLWALRRLHQYTVSTADRSLLEDKYPLVEHFFVASLGFVQKGLLPSGGIIDKMYLWETWEDTPYTPRDGYPVEIELLWLTALADYLPVIQKRNPELAERMTETLEEGRKSFELFFLDGYLADSLSYDWQPRMILTPNGYVAFALRYPLPPALKHQMVLLGRQQLAGRVGIRSLAPRDWARVLSPEFLSDPHNVEHGNMRSVGTYNYHRGIEWLWLNQFFVEAELRCGETNTAFSTYLHGQVHSTLHEAGVGGLSELYDSHGSLGADFQAWSMAGFIDGLRSFTGVEIDAIERRISIRPSIPDCWPGLKSRHRAGNAHFEMTYARDGHGTQTVRVRPTTTVPAGYTLRIGIRAPIEEKPRQVSRAEAWSHLSSGR